MKELVEVRKGTEARLVLQQVPGHVGVGVTSRWTWRRMRLEGKHEEG